MRDIPQLLTLAGLYREAENIALSTLSNKVFGDGKRFGALEIGADLHSRRLNLAFQWFADHWPDDKVAWPLEIERPERSQPAQEAAMTGG